MNKYPKRKRLKDFDYSSNGAYFITICIKNMECILSTVVAEGFHALPKLELTSIGEICEQTILHINSSDEDFNITKYVVMPNHIHLLIEITSGGRGSPPLQDIIKRFKSFTTKKYGSVLWQRSFYDHIIRNDDDLYYHLQYIDENPKKWLMGKDEYYS